MTRRLWAQGWINYHLEHRNQEQMLLYLLLLVQVWITPYCSTIIASYISWYWAPTWDLCRLKTKVVPNPPFQPLKGTASTPILYMRVHPGPFTPSPVNIQLGLVYHRSHWYATLENKTPAETFPKFPLVLPVIDISDRNPPITAC